MSDKRPPETPASNHDGVMEQETRTPLMTEAQRRVSGMAIGAVSLVALGAIFYLRQGDEGEARRQQTEVGMAARKPLPDLKPQSSAPLDEEKPVGAGAPPRQAQTPAEAALDPQQAQQQQLALQRVEQERAMREARLKSAIILPLSQSGDSARPVASSESGSQGNGLLGGSAAGSGGERGAQDANSRFARAVSGNGVPVSEASRLDHLQYKILQGKQIEAVLEPRAVSDLPGQICATVQRDVYGAQGRIKLIPWGSRVCGVYSAELRKGQDRLFAIWNMLYRPDGVEVALDSGGADQLGSAGMGGIVDSHFAQIFGTSALLSIIGAGAANVGVSSSDQNNSAAYYRQQVQQAAAQTSQQVLQPYLAIQPTVTVPAGSRVRIYLNRHLDFTPIYQAETEAVRPDAGPLHLM
ncbi:type VI secretion protein [Chromobacterium amazonense]|uniref:Type VI secretion protein n=1 Tax=Chromobacterium amazonense TaxID=1382803 RepID=A0A2S9WZA0_9NEIS|nr:TrbI/VirB10 family protein [Chromobacterium amazonense]PRP68797.1 type VI secretion protein [Chromobacterium amazonense]